MALVQEEIARAIPQQGTRSTDSDLCDNTVVVKDSTGVVSDNECKAVCKILAAHQLSTTSAKSTFPECRFGKADHFGVLFIFSSALVVMLAL